MPTFGPPKGHSLPELFLSPFSFIYFGFLKLPAPSGELKRQVLRAGGFPNTIGIDEAKTWLWEIL
jgi:hypothetical protein